jgi:hypothetical protein
MSEFYGNMTVKIYDKDDTEQLSLAVKKVEIIHEHDDFYAPDGSVLKRLKNITVIASTNNR